MKRKITPLPTGNRSLNNNSEGLGCGLIEALSYSSTEENPEKPQTEWP
jgi:hypothetical protein